MQIGVLSDAVLSDAQLAARVAHDVMAERLGERMPNLATHYDLAKMPAMVTARVPYVRDGDSIYERAREAADILCQEIINRRTYLQSLGLARRPIRFYRVEDAPDCVERYQCLGMGVAVRALVARNPREHGMSLQLNVAWD